MKFSQMMLILILTVNISYGSISDANGLTSDGIISDGEYGTNVQVSEDSILTFTGGGSNVVELGDYSHLEVISTKTPLSGYYEGGVGFITLLPMITALSLFLVV